VTFGKEYDERQARHLGLALDHLLHTGPHRTGHPGERVEIGRAARPAGPIGAVVRLRVR
jgi:hypothetical protein